MCGWTRYYVDGGDEMKRVPKKLSYTFSSSPALPGESHTHRMKGKGSKPYRASQLPKGSSKQSAGFAKDVHYGSHKSVEQQIGAEMRRLGL